MKHIQFLLVIIIFSNSFSVYVVVQFYPWFKFFFLLFQPHYHVIIIHYHTQKQKKRKFEPRIKLNHNIYTMDAALAELKIGTNMVTNATKIFSLATKNSGLVATLATRFLFDLDLK